MKYEDVMVRVQEIVRFAMGDPSLVLTPASKVPDVPGWDSFNQVTIFLDVEEAFNIELRSREIDEIGSVGDLVDLVHSKVAA